MAKQAKNKIQFQISSPMRFQKEVPKESLHGILNTSFFEFMH